MVSSHLQRQVASPLRPRKSEGSNTVDRRTVGDTEDLEEESVASIYRVARSIKRNQNSLYNALRSIYEDSIFVAEIAELWPDLPFVANLRCGLWYSPRFEATCYFKSTDGHANNWSFSTSRLNLHLALLVERRMHYSGFYTQGEALP